MTKNDQALILEAYEYSEEQGFDIVKTIEYVKNFSGLSDQRIQSYLQDANFMDDFNAWKDGTFYSKNTVKPTRTLINLLNMEMKQKQSELNEMGTQFVKEHTQYERGMFIKLIHEKYNKRGGHKYFVVFDVEFNPDSKLENFESLVAKASSSNGKIEHQSPFEKITEGDVQIFYTIKM